MYLNSILDILKETEPVFSGFFSLFFFFALFSLMDEEEGVNLFDRRMYRYKQIVFFLQREGLGADVLVKSAYLEYLGSALQSLVRFSFLWKCFEMK